LTDYKSFAGNDDNSPLTVAGADPGGGDRSPKT